MTMMKTIMTMDIIMTTTMITTTTTGTNAPTATITTAGEIGGTQQPKGISHER